MRRSVLLPAFAVMAMLMCQPLSVHAQGKTANLFGFEKADYVKGMVSINASGNSIALVGFQTVYVKPLVVYLTRAFDRSEVYKVGEVAPGKSGDLFFDIPALDVGAFDSVLVVVPEWNIPVGVGLLQ